jgi:tetratricopeptide (TPR) repeat protein
MTTNECRRGAAVRAGPQWAPTLKLAVALAMGTAVVGCAGLGKDRLAWQGAREPQMRAMPLRVTGTESASAYYVLGRYYYFNGEYARAEQAYRMAASLDPADPEPLNGLAVLHDRLGLFALSADDYRAALARAPNAAHILANLGYSLLIQGRGAEALAPLRRAVELAPGNAIAQASLARAQAATALASTAGASPASTAGPTGEPAVREASALPVSWPGMPQLVGKLAPLPVSLAAREVASMATGAGIVSSIVGATEPVAEPAVAEPALAGADMDKPLIASIQGAEMHAAVPLRQMFAGVRVELANGNGVNGMARALGVQLRDEGLRVARLTNALPFDKRQTVIVCAAALEDRAAALGRNLRVSPRIVVGSTLHRNVDLRVILGADAVPRAMPAKQAAAAVPGLS